MRCAVMMGDGFEAVDVSPVLTEGGGLSSAIRRARLEDRSLAAVVHELAAEGKERLRVDLERAQVVQNSQPYPLTVPVLAPEIWAAGVTYLKSRAAREFESEALNRTIYSRVYDAQRPEVFLKDANCRRTVGSGGEIFVRGDSSWTVPEPELGLILDARGTIVAHTIGNDVSARDIEAESPLYLPQAKIYENCCAIGPVALIPEEGHGGEQDFKIELRIWNAARELLFKDETSTAQMKRTFETLVSYLCRYNLIEDGTVLLTGTGVVPPDDFCLEEGQVVEISVSGIGTLRNRVRRLPS